MGDRSTIEWTDATWNPVTGCSKVSPGCAHCYAEAISLRFARSAGPWTPANAEANVVLHPERLDQPLRWRRPRMVFVNSMSDLFHEQVPGEYINRVWMTMRNAPQHTYQVLTKRPERLLEWTRIAARAKCWPVEEIWPPWVWLGVSIENRRFVHRADVLRQVPMEPGGVRFISAEPLLGPLVYERYAYTDSRGTVDCWRDTHLDEAITGNFLPQLELDGIDWLIVGGESGPQHRPIRPEWVWALRDAAASEGTAFFFKQWGGRTPKAGGRELDGRTWDEMPTPKETVA